MYDCVCVIQLQYIEQHLTYMYMQLKYVIILQFKNAKTQLSDSITIIKGDKHIHTQYSGHTTKLLRFRLNGLIPIENMYIIKYIIYLCIFKNFLSSIQHGLILKTLECIITKRLKKKKNNN